MTAADFDIVDTPDTMPAGTPPLRSADGHRLALTRPANHRQVEWKVELIARTTRGLIVVRSTGKGRPYWSIVSFRLVDAATRRQLRPADFADLPWQGKGPDPDATPQEKP